MKYVYKFFEGKKDDLDLLGGKGANLSEMTNLGLPVPQGFTITTEACKKYLNDKDFSFEDLKKEIIENIKFLEKKTNKSFNDLKNPLLVSVRSGSKFSMPGMLDTILNIGLNDKTVETLKYNTQNGRFAYDCYRRLIQMYSDVVSNVDKSYFERVLKDFKKKYNAKNDSDLDEEQLKELVVEFKKIFKTELKKDFPQDPYEQIFMAVKAVFESWNNNRARTYRTLNNISHSLGTAVNIQQMVFGNCGNDSGSGVAFTRNPSTGDKGIFGEFLVNSQGEDVVAGIRTPQKIEILKENMIDTYNQFVEICELLEKHYKDMQDIEFTIESKKLYILQTRNGKRTANASIKIFLSLLEEGIIDEKTALLKLDASSVEQLLHPIFEIESLKKAKHLAKGLPACPGSATGKVYFDSNTAYKKHIENEKVILVREETNPEDIEGMNISEAIVTSTGGMTSHAAVVARGMGICCVVGCNKLLIDYDKKQAKIGEKIINEGDIISVDGSTGNIYLGKVKKSENNNNESLDKIMKLVKNLNDKYNLTPVKVYANADTPKDINKAISLGADGIGLIRTEHMFFDNKRILSFRKMFLSKNENELTKNLDVLKKYQKEDFYNIFKESQNITCTIRLLDPPLHEFLPKNEDEYKELAKEMNEDINEIKKLGSILKEMNPMLGHRGCRLGITIPDIYKMQSLSIIEAAIEFKNKYNKEVQPSIMIPLVGTDQELAYLKNIITETVKKYLLEKNETISYYIGSMLEIPRACLVIKEILKYSQFFSFGTNDLTQLTYGFSRDDSHKFLNYYRDNKIIEFDPFQTIDKEGVGALMKMAIDTSKNIKKDIKIGVCGEVAGDPQSIYFFDKINVDYVSCSPYRIPTAKIAATQAQLKNKKLN